MGYTHYWKWHTAPDAERFTQWSADVKTLLDSLFLYPEITEDSLVIRGPNGTGSPVLTSSLVAFNGDADTDENHESFYLDFDNPQPWLSLSAGRYDFAQAPFDSFCKTARCPYDLIVTAALIRLAHYFPTEVKISSDGEAEDWASGSLLCQKVFGAGDIPLQDGIDG